MFPIEPLGGSGVFKTAFRSVGFLWESWLQTEIMQSREPAFESFGSSWPGIFPLGCRLFLTLSPESMGFR